MTQNNILYLNLPSISKIRVHLLEKCVFYWHWWTLIQAHPIFMYIGWLDWLPV